VTTYLQAFTETLVPLPSVDYSHRVDTAAGLRVQTSIDGDNASQYGITTTVLAPIDLEAQLDTDE
jgi:hypothetical protein